MRKGLRDGKGFHTFADNDVNSRVSYEGEWKEDKNSGNGTLIWKKGAKFVGEFLNGLRHGHGVLTYAEDSALLSYYGEWKEGKTSGIGTLIWKYGAKYVGEFFNDLYQFLWKLLFEKKSSK